MTTAGSQILRIGLSPTNHAGHDRAPMFVHRTFIPARRARRASCCAMFGDKANSGRMATQEPDPHPLSLSRRQLGETLDQPEVSVSDQAIALAHEATCCSTESCKLASNGANSALSWK